jgi:hypothetical protein
MLVGGAVEMFLGVDAERRSLEDLALPLGVAGLRRDHLAAVTGAPHAPSARTVVSEASPSLEETRGRLQEAREQRDRRRHEVRGLPPHHRQPPPPPAAPS